MKNLTEPLREWLINTYGVPEDADDDELRQAAASALTTGDLELSEYQAMTATRSAKDKLSALVDERLAAHSNTGGNMSTATATPQSIFGGHDVAQGRATGIGMAEPQHGAYVPDSTRRGKGVGMAVPDGSRVNAMPPGHSLKDYRYTAKHAKYGFTVKNEDGHDAWLPSERDFYLFGVYMKYAAKKRGFVVNMNEYEQRAFDMIVADHTWCGDWDGSSEVRRNVHGSEVKAILDDATSGGSHVSPEWFDEMITTFPLLHGQLAPFVTLINQPRGSAFEGAAIGNPTLSSTGEGSAISAFNTNDLITALTGSVFPISCFVEAGNDWLMDNAVNAGEIVLRNIGKQMLKWLDEQIANGDGVIEPTGIFNSSTNTGSYENGTSGDPTAADYLRFIFGINKEYRDEPGSFPAFVGNDTTYQRAREIATGVTGDTRFIFGNDVEDYVILGRPYKVQNDIGNQSIAFGDLKKYKLYKRQGVAFRQSSEGNYFMSRNLTGFFVRQRYGGIVEDSGGFVVATNGQA